MPQVVRLPDYAGICICYEKTAHPFFEVAVLEALSRIKATRTGAELLRLIGETTPSFKGDATFPSGMKVMIVPVADSKVMPRGYKTLFGHHTFDQALYDADQRPLRPKGTTGETVHIASSQAAASKAGEGTVVTIQFTNVINHTTKGEFAPACVMLAHELIHAYHALSGNKKDGPDEELFTVGLGEFSGERISENKIRGDLRLEPRKEY